MRHRIQILDQGHTGGGEARHRFKKGVHNIGVHSGKIERQNGKQRKHYPHHAGEQESFAAAHTRIASGHMVEPCTTHRRCQCRIQKSQRAITLAIEQRHQKRQQHKPGFYQQKQTDDSQHDGKIDMMGVLSHAYFLKNFSTL